MQTSEKLLAGRYRVDPMPLLVCRFSSLLRAVDVETGQNVVLRRLEPPTQDRVQARAQTLGEGRRMSELRHHNLPHVERILEGEEQVYLVLENFTGPTLEQLVIQHGPVPPATLPKLIDQLMSVLDFLHSQSPPIIHRDLRPEVVILTPDATIMLAEFGLAKMHADAADDKTSFRAHGSPNYASPEQLLGEPSHKRQDLYSLGAILYYLATGQPPEKSLERCFNAGVASTVPGLPEGFPQELGEFITRLLETDADKRPQRVGEARSLLPELQSEAPPPPLPAPRPAKARVSLDAPPPPSGGLARLLEGAWRAGARHLHVRPSGEVRWRVNGALAPQGQLTPAELQHLLQGKHPVAGGEVTARSSVLGDSQVVRLVAQEPPRELTQLGCSEAVLERLRALLAAGPGVLLVAGPGRATTLRAGLRELATPGKHVLALESAPRLVPEGVVAAPLRAESLAELWHQDADLVLVDDVVTAADARAVQSAALRGAQLLVGVRAADALSALRTWRELTGEDSEVHGAVAQRLVRRLCPACRHEVPALPEHAATFERFRLPSREYRAPGCAQCDQGFTGQLGLFEVLAATAELSAALPRGLNSDEVRRATAAQGFQPLLHDGLHKVSAGLTAFSELV